MKDRIYQTINSKQFLQFTVVVLGILVIILAIFLLKNNPNRQFNKIIHSNDISKLTSPILDCEQFEQGEESVVPYKEVLNFVDKIKEQDSVSSIAVYFRDLNDGPWVGVNEKDYFSPASLLKLPLLISFLKYVEDKPDILQKQTLVVDEDKSQTLSQNLKPVKSLLEGQEYTLEKVASTMIQYSDNLGAHVLARNIPYKYLKDLYRAIGVNYQVDSTDINIRVKDYASFFRVLYNASYLNRDMSEKALEILTKTEYKNGLVAGVPDGVVVAHKFGERSSAEVAFGNGVLNGETQLHDCGIVYYPARPYILCIMTRGFDFKDQEKAIKDISAFFYKKIDVLHK